MMKNGIFIAALLYLTMLWACGNSGKNQQDTGTQAIQAGEVQSELIVNVDNLRLREAPGAEEEVIKTLPKGSRLVDLGQVSDFTTKVILRGIPYDEPWLKVRTSEGIEGWVYAGAVNFNMDHPSAIAHQLMHKRMLYLFGESLTKKIEQYRLQYNAARRSREFAAAYRTGTKLRDTLVSVMERKLEIVDFELAPDLFWLKDAIACYVPQLVAEGTQYYLFQDFRCMQHKALETQGREDDEYIELCLQIYPEDSIEYFYPAWFMQTWDYGGHSLLGRGIHYDILSEMDEVLENDDLFANEILKYKARLIDDITSNEVTYWESQDKIISEVDSILNAGLEILSAADKIALNTRKIMFEDPAANGIQLNVRSGLTEF